MTEREIISGLLEDRRETLSYIYNEYYDRIRIKLLSLGGSLQEVEDVFQESIVDMIYSLKQNKFKGDSKLSTYLFSIAKFKFYNLKKKKRVTTVDIDNHMHFFQDEELLNDDYRISQVVKALESIDEKCRAILKSYYYNGLGLKPLSIEMGLTYDFIRQKKRRCLDKIKAQFN